MTLFSFIIRETQIKSWTEVRLLTYQLCTNPSEMTALGRKGVLIRCRRACLPSCFRCLQFFATLWTVAHQAPLSMGTLQARILEWAAVPSSRGSLRPGIESMSLVSPAWAGGLFTASATWEGPYNAGWCTKWHNPMEGDLATSGKTTEAWPPLT